VQQQSAQFAPLPPGRKRRSRIGVRPNTLAEQVLKILQRTPGKVVRSIDLFYEVYPESALETYSNPQGGISNAIWTLRKHGHHITATRPSRGSPGGYTLHPTS